MTPDGRPPAFGGGKFLVDNSAWWRLGDPLVADVAVALVDNGQLLVSGPFIFEALHSARGKEEFELLRQRLRSDFEPVELTSATWALAEQALEELAALWAGNHRQFSTTDVLLAALAHENELGVLHYDDHFDALRQDTSLEFRSQWLAARGRFTVPPPPSPRKRRNQAIRQRLAIFKDEAEAKPAQLAVAALLDQRLKDAGHQVPPPLE